jgi:MFS family permease
MWAVLGVAQGVKGILSFLSAPLLGGLSDSFGRKPFLLLTVLCTCLPLPFLFLRNLWGHVIMVALSGFFSVTFSIVFAYVSDVTTLKERSAAYGQV